MQKKIYYHNTDCGGVVYYANYLKFLEEARTEYFSQKGFSIKELAQELHTSLHSFIDALSNYH